MVLNVLALWKQEARHSAPRSAARAAAPHGDETFGAAWRHFSAGAGVRPRLLVIALGTLAFGMQDVLLEPYGGQVLGLGVGATTWLTATLALGGLVGFSVASVVLGRGADPLHMAAAGAIAGLPAFVAVLAGGGTQSVPLFAAGVFAIGLGGGLFGHGTLTATMNSAPPDQAGLALGVWGAVQATSAGVGVAAGGVLRDIVAALTGHGQFGATLAGPATGYATVYLVEIALLLATLAVLARLIRPHAAPTALAASPGLPARAR
jgi:BCD family chlorophyll transporter-like MFS transporter